MTNLYTLFRTRNSEPYRPFIRAANGREISYLDCFAETGRFANALVAVGIKPGDRIAVQIDKSVEAIFLYLACLRVGAVFPPLNTAYTITELSYFIADAQPSLVVCRPEQLDTMKKLCVELGVDICESLGREGDGTITEVVEIQNSYFEDVMRDKRDLAAILYTSGTTGRSKGAMLTHGNLASNAETLMHEWAFTPQDVLLHALPIFHTHGLFVALNVTLMTGSSVILLPEFDASQVLLLLKRATCMMGVPTFYTRLLQQPALDSSAVENIRLFVSGSAPLLADTHREWFDRTGHSILERYGMTETNMNSSNPYDGPRKPGTVGLPLPGIEIRVAHTEHGSEMPRGEIGMIQIRGPNVFSGYWKMPEKTASEFSADGFFISGDLGRFDEDGYLSIVGRGKDMIISGGYNIYPKEVETELDAIPGIIESAVIGLPHRDFGEGVAAVIVIRPDHELDERIVISALKEKLAKYKQPKKVFVVDSLPRNGMGKIQKNVLRDQYMDAFSVS